MKTYKKLAVCLCMVLILSVAMICVVNAAAENMVITAEDVTAEPEAVVTMDLRMSKNTYGVLGMMIGVTPDEGLDFYVETIQVDDGEGVLVPEEQPVARRNSDKGTIALGKLTFTPGGDITARPYNLLWDGTDALEQNGYLVTLYFKAPATPGVYNVTLTATPDDIYDDDWNNIPTTLVSGTVTVKAAGRTGDEEKTEIEELKSYDSSQEVKDAIDASKLAIDEIYASTTLTEEEKIAAAAQVVESIKKRCGMLNLHFQLPEETTIETAQTDLRIVGTVDSLNYKDAGFYISIDGGEEHRFSTKTVYEAIDATAGGVPVTYSPEGLYKDAKFFTTYTLFGIPKADYNTTITVRGFVVTFDDEEIGGVSKTRTISGLLD